MSGSSALPTEAIPVPIANGEVVEGGESKVAETLELKFASFAR